MLKNIGPEDPVISQIDPLKDFHTFGKNIDIVIAVPGISAEKRLSFVLVELYNNKLHMRVEISLLVEEILFTREHSFIHGGSRERINRNMTVC